MSERAEREVRSQNTAHLLDEGLPHEAAGGVVGEGEVDRLVKEFLELLLGAGLGLARAPDDRHAEVVLYELALPLGEGLLDPLRRVRVLLRFLALLALLLRRPDLLRLVDVDN